MVRGLDRAIRPRGRPIPRVLRSDQALLLNLAVDRHALAGLPYPEAIAASRALETRALGEAGVLARSVVLRFSSILEREAETESRIDEVHLAAGRLAAGRLAAGPEADESAESKKTSKTHP